MSKILLLSLLICLLFIACQQNNNSAQAQINKPEESSVRSTPTATPTPVNSNSSQNEVDDKPQVNVTTTYEDIGLQHNTNPKPGEHYKPAWIENDEKSDNGFEPFCVQTKIKEKVIEKCGYQDKKGKILIKPVYAVVYPFSEELAGVCPKNDTVCGYINEKGQLLLKWYQSVGKFSEGLADVAIGDLSFYKHGYINKTGKYVIKPKYSDSAPFKNGVAEVEVQRSLRMCIDKKDKEIACPQQ